MVPHTMISFLSFIFSDFKNFSNSQGMCLEISKKLLFVFSLLIQVQCFYSATMLEGSWP